MKSFQETIYLNSPIFFQNILVSIKGCMLARIRHGGEYPYFYNSIKKRNSWSFEHHKKYQEQQFLALAKHACENIPFYSKLYASHGISLEDFNNIDDLQKLPIISKKDIKQSGSEFLDSRYGKKGLLDLHTTGTTGTPLKVLADHKTRQMNYAFFDAYLNSLGLKRAARKATIGGRVIVPPSQNAPPFWRYALFQQTLFLSSYHLSDKNLPFYVDKLNSYKPEFIDSYPSSVYHIARFILSKNLKVHRPKAIITSAETLYSEQRKIIEKAFDCQIFDQYGAAEMCGFIGQCRKGCYHIRSDFGIVEFIKNGNPVKPGEAGELVLTGFLNRRMPLIRYNIGDIAIPSSKVCDCGLNTPLVEEIKGRIDDVVFTKSGTPIGRLSPVLKGFPIKEAQYVQEQKGKLIVYIVKESSFDEHTTQSIVEEIQKRVGNDMEIILKFVEKIKKGKGAKAKSVISRIK